MKSRTLLEKTTNALQLNIRYYKIQQLKDIEIDPKAMPYSLQVLQLDESRLTDTELIVLEAENSRFYLKYGSTSKWYLWSDTIKLPYGKFIFKKIEAELYDTGQFKIEIKRKDDVVASIRENLVVLPTTKTVSTIDLTISDAIPRRGEDILNTLLLIYDQLNIDDKNRIADSTISFIDERLEIVGRELGSVEAIIQGFRQSNKLTNIDFQGKYLLDNSQLYLKELTTQQVEIEILISLEDYLNNKNNKARLVPSTLSIQEPTLIGLVQSYNSAQIERDKLIQTTGGNNPMMQQLDIQIENLKNDILSSLSSIKRAMIIKRDELSNKTKSINRQLNNVPETERTFIEYSRQQSIKQELYLYLLKKREETAVSKSANVDNSRVVDSAKTENEPYKPKKKVIYLTAFIFGLILPNVIFIARSILNNKVLFKNDITDRTTVPILGEIGHNKNQASVVLREGSRSLIAEQFRSLRTNLQYILPGKNEKCVLITSSMSGEGKSFIGINLASAISVMDKSVVLVELDLRKPKICSTLGLSYNKGFSSYVIGSSEIDEIIMPSNVHPKFFVIPSGPLPPNPSELIMYEKVKILFEKLKQQFDYIIIDSSPIGLVTDAQLLANYADCSLFIIRQRHTFKQQISFVEDYRNSRKLPRLNIVLNDINVSMGYGYGYGYGVYNNSGYYKEVKDK